MTSKNNSHTSFPLYWMKISYSLWKISTLRLHVEVSEHTYLNLAARSCPAFCPLLYVEQAWEWKRHYRIAGNFRGRKLLQILRFCSYSQKFSPANWRAWHIFGSTSKQSTKVFSTKIVFFTNSWKFSLTTMRYIYCIILIPGKKFDFCNSKRHLS